MGGVVPPPAIPSPESRRLAGIAATDLESSAGIVFTNSGRESFELFVAAGVHNSAMDADRNIGNLVSRIIDAAAEEGVNRIDAGIWERIKVRLCPSWPWCPPDQ